MFTVNYQILVGIGIYLIAMLVIGLYHIRRSNTSLEEYYIANRSFGPGVAYFTGMGEAFWTALGLFIVMFYTMLGGFQCISGDNPVFGPGANYSILTIISTMAAVSTGLIGRAVFPVVLEIEFAHAHKAEAEGII